MEQPKSLKFNRKQPSEFHAAVRKRVNEYFKKNNLSKHANGAMITKTVFILSVFVATYFLLLSNWFSPGVLLLIAMVNGFFTALIGLNIAHDAIHGSYSSKPWVNKLLSACFNIIGANDYVWKVKHNIVHHTFTNIPEHDDDINQVSLIRLNPSQELWWIHRFQHFYVFLLYPLASISWVMFKDYVNFFKPNFGWYDNTKYPKIEVYRLFIFKAIYYTLFLVIPLVVIDLPWYAILLGFVALHLVEGITLSLIFQLAHVVEGTQFPEPDEDGNLPDNWAAHQMYTTANFARKNPLANFLFGGLNFQVEHHLFPAICHIHYAAIAPIVKETAEEHNLPYIENETFFGAIASHLRLMKKFGRGEEQEEFARAKTGSTTEVEALQQEELV